MIERLRIRELALVEELELEFGPGLNLLTGETGAGKSIVLGALALLAGGRADRDAIREGADEAVVEAVFDITKIPELEAELAERGLEAEEGALIVRRSLHRTGRARAWVGGQLVPVSTLAELFAARIEVSSQHASHKLLSSEPQGRLLDQYGGLLDERRGVEEGVRALRSRAAEIEQLRSAAEERARREDFLAFQVSEIDEAELDPDEDESLTAEHRRLVHAETLGGDARQVVALLSGDPSEGGESPVGDRLGDAARKVAGLAQLDEELAPLAERLESASAEITDVARDLERYASGVETHPARLAEVEERIQRVEALKRKYGATVSDILGFRDRAAGELATLGGSDERMGKLEVEQQAETRRVAGLAKRLSKGRTQAAKAFAAAAQEGARQLAMEKAEVQVALEAVEAEDGMPCGPCGAETAEILFSANPGEPARPLRRVASGGELSRVFLALKTVLRTTSAGMVLVFDEVDAGIGGAVAERVGGVLATLAESHQVLCITHLPQIAAQAGTHFRVAKAEQGGRTRTGVDLLADEDRIQEVARMAGGETPGAETRSHAEALLTRTGAVQSGAKRSPAKSRAQGASSKASKAKARPKSKPKAKSKTKRS